MGVVERVQQLVSPILADLGLDTYDLEYAGGTLKVVLDKDGGIDLEELALATRLISRELDHVDPIPGRYTLEITSPGLERQLRTPAHYLRAVGTTVNVRTLPHVEGDRRLQGVLLAADDGHITVRIDEPGPQLGVERTLALADVERARTVFEWGGAPKPGGGSRPGSAKSTKSAKGSTSAKGGASARPGTGPRSAARTRADAPGAGTTDEVHDEEGAAKP